MAGKKNEKRAGSKSVPFFKLFSFADSTDILLMIVGTLGAVGNGITMPLLTVVFGQLTDAFGQTNTQETVNQVSKVSLKFVYLGCASAVLAFLEIACWMCTGERQASRIRILYLKAILKQDIAFFDRETNTGEVIGRMSGDTVLIQDAMGEKIGKFIQYITTFIGGLIVAFVQGWKLTIVLLSVLPLIILANAILTSLISRMAIRGQAAYAKAATIVEQVVGGIRTVASFAGERKAVADYDMELHRAYKASVFQGVATGCGVGSTMAVMVSSYGLAFWYGATLVLKHQVTGGDVLIVLFAVLTGGMSLGQTSPCISAFASGRAAAYKMFEAIERNPVIDPFDPNGITLDNMKGDIELRNVVFAYPARPDVLIFKDFSIVIPTGKTAALVGESGSGKSTVISLIERFYDPQGGHVLVDGVDICQLQLKWLREQVGLVSQEPVLFGTSIKENIAYGRDGATEDEIQHAATLANATKFVDKMPQGYDTEVGEHGTQLSGGQKQRIAIARAILKNPQILLLDEATSALDAESERLVQEALDRIMQNRTTVIVAHRLSTIKNADKISVVQRGTIVEEGTHLELLQRPEGAYTQLVRLQQIHQNKLEKALAEVVDPNEISLSSSSTSSRKLSRSSFSLNRSLSLTPSPPEEIENDIKAEPTIGNSFLRLMAMNKPEAPIFLIGLVGAAGNGMVLPVLGLVLTTALVTLFDLDRQKLRHDSDFWSIMFVVIGVGSFIVSVVQMACFGVIGQRLVRRVRRMSFEKIVRQEVGWFDNSENSSGAISSRLSTDAVHLQRIVGDSLSLAVQNIATICAGLLISFTANWTLSLVVLALMPLFGLEGLMQDRLLQGFTNDIQTMYEEATKVASDAVSSINTVASYCLEERLIKLYKERCKLPLKAGLKTGVVSGIGLGLSQFFSYSAYALSFWYGAKLVEEHKTNFKDVFQVFFAISISAMGISETISFVPDLVKIKSAASSIFKILDRKSKVDPCDPSGKTLDCIKGNIEFRHVSFTYPTRPNAPIFTDLSFKIEAGKTMALVGESGSGKSTVITLLERFYDPNAGTVLLDGIDIKGLQLRWLRQSMGLVSQEPILFSGTIRSNIGYGKDGEVSEQEIQSAASAANADNFIRTLPKGYDTEVGDRGIQLSGGQKQRIAIARAVIKNPRILLLDEATSALDAESEHIVQEALDRLMVNLTTIVVAHRLSTIVNVDVISVVKNGAIVEQGSHKELISKPYGAYASLVTLHQV